ncbi:MAG: hypothetical protein K2H87_07915, partial [Duncaniella sp.]|nr:hypothetical protein [Duncaniella sp.]
RPLDGHHRVREEDEFIFERPDTTEDDDLEEEWDDEEWDDGEEPVDTFGYEYLAGNEDTDGGEEDTDTKA